MSGLQHLIVVAVDGKVGVHIAVTSVHMQRNPDAAFENALVNRVALVQDGLELRARENVFEHSADLRFPTRAQTVVL